MKAIFVANLDIDESEGIFKKVRAEAAAIGDAVGECDLVVRRGEYARVYHNNAYEKDDIQENLYGYIVGQIKTGKIGLLYVRHMIPSHKLISILKAAKHNGLRLYYEIPTYPYWGEQIKTSRKKYRAIIKVFLDIIFSPIIYHYIDHLVVIRSNTKTKSFSKMVEINNGVKTDDIVSKDYSKRKNDGTFKMVAVGTLYPYHGYDRILKGLAECKETVCGKIVEFHVVGSSQTIDELHDLSNKMGLRHVVFHGVKTTDELNHMYDGFDVGLGCLALHRRNADIDTTLKIIEYYCRGVMAVTSGISPMDKINKAYTIHVDDSDKSIDISSIYFAFMNTPKENKEVIADKAKKVFSWNAVLGDLLSDIAD